MLDALHLCHRSSNTTNDYLTKETKDSSHQNADCSQYTTLRIVGIMQLAAIRIGSQAWNCNNSHRETKLLSSYSQISIDYAAKCFLVSLSKRLL